MKWLSYKGMTDLNTDQELLSGIEKVCRKAQEHLAYQALSRPQRNSPQQVRQRVRQQAPISRPMVSPPVHRPSNQVPSFQSPLTAFVNKAVGQKFDKTALKALVLQEKSTNPNSTSTDIFNKIRNALNDAGSKMSDVIRTRMYLTDINDWETVARVHGDIFSDIKPVSTLVEVSGLIDKELLIEIEVSAVVSDRL